MDIQQPVNPTQTPDNSGIPQGIPTGVFVPNTQVSAQTPVQNTFTQVPVQVSVEPVQQFQQQVSVAAVQQLQPVAQPAQAPATPATQGPLDKFFLGIARFFAKIMGQPDPITGAPNPASQVLQKSGNIVGQIRGVANQAVQKATDVANQAVTSTTTSVTLVQPVQPQSPVVTPPESSAPVISVQSVQQPTPQT